MNRALAPAAPLAVPGVGGAPFEDRLDTDHPPPVTALRSASYYLYMPHGPEATPIDHSEQLAYEWIDFPKVRAAGFNAVWLVELSLDPESVIPDLEAARASGLNVILPLNYGWGDLTKDSLKLAQWYASATALLQAIDDYRDMVYPLVFHEGCAYETTVVLNTIGSFPEALGPALRSRWSLGWYGGAADLYAATPPARGYDWVGFAEYFFDESFTFWPVDHSPTDDEVVGRLTWWLNWTRLLYPNLPVIIAESGYYTCRSQTLPRAGEVYALVMQWGIENGLGVNLWGYRTLLTPEEECLIRGGKGGHSLTNPDGSPRPALLDVEQVLKERMPVIPPPGGPEPIALPER